MASKSKYLTEPIPLELLVTDNMIHGNSISNYSYECFIENHIFIKLMSQLLESYVEPYTKCFRCHIINSTYYKVNFETLSKWFLSGSEPVSTYTLKIQYISYVLLKKGFNQEDEIFILFDPRLLKYWKENYVGQTENVSEIPNEDEKTNNADLPKLNPTGTEEFAWKNYDETILKLVENFIFPEMRNPNIIFADVMFSDEKLKEFDGTETILELIGRSFLWIFNRKSQWFKNRKRDFYNRNCKKLLWYTDFHEYGLACVPFVYKFILVDISFEYIAKGLRINFRKRPYDPKYNILRNESESNVEIEEQIDQENKIDFWTGYQRFGDDFLKRTFTAIIDGKDFSLMKCSADVWPEKNISTTIDSTNSTKNFTEKNFIVIDTEQVPDILKRFEVEIIIEEITNETQSFISNEGNYQLQENRTIMDSCDCPDVVDLDLYQNVMDTNNYYIKFIQESYENEYMIENNENTEEIESSLNVDENKDIFLQMKVTSDGSLIFFVRRTNYTYVKNEYARNSGQYSLTVGGEKHSLEICFFENLQKVYFECHENDSKSKFIAQEIFQKFYNEHDHKRTVMWLNAKSIKLNGLKWHGIINAIEFSFCLFNCKSFLTGEEKDTSLLISDLPNDLVIIVVDKYSWAERLDAMTIESDDDEYPSKNNTEEPGRKKSLPLQKKYAIGQSIAKKIRSENDSMFLSGNRSNLPKNPNKQYNIVNNKVVKIPIIKDTSLNLSAATLVEGSMLESKEEVKYKAIKFQPDPTLPGIKVKEACKANNLKKITQRRTTLGSNLELKKIASSNSSQLSTRISHILNNIEPDKNANPLEGQISFDERPQFIARNKRFLNQWNDQQKLLEVNTNQIKENLGIQSKTGSMSKGVLQGNVKMSEMPLTSNDDLLSPKTEGNTDLKQQEDLERTDRINIKPSSVIPKKRRMALQGSINMNNYNDSFGNLSTDIEPQIQITYNKNLPNNEILPIITYDCSKLIPNITAGHNNSQRDISTMNTTQATSSTLNEENTSLHRAFFYRNVDSDSENSQQCSSPVDISSSSTKKQNIKCTTVNKINASSVKKEKAGRPKRSASNSNKKEKIFKKELQSFPSYQTTTSELLTTSQINSEHKMKSISSSTSLRDSKLAVEITSVKQKTESQTPSNSISTNSATLMLPPQHQPQASNLMSMYRPALPILNRRQSICVDNNDGILRRPSSSTTLQPLNATACAINSRRHSIAYEQMSPLMTYQGNSNEAVGNNTQAQSEASELKTMQLRARPVINRRQSVCVDDNTTKLKLSSSLTTLQRPSAESLLINSQGNSTAYEQISMTPSQGDSNQAVDSNTTNKRKKPKRKTRLDIHPINPADLILQGPPSNCPGMQSMQPPTRPILNRRQSICVDNCDTSYRNQSSSPEQLKNKPTCKISNRRQTIAVEDPQFGSQTMVSNPINSVDLTLQRTHSEASDLKLMLRPARPILDRRQSISVDNNDQIPGRPSSSITLQALNARDCSINSRRYSIAYEQMTLSQGDSNQAVDSNTPNKRTIPNPKTRFDNHPKNTVDLMLQRPPSNFSEFKLMQPPHARPIKNRRQSMCIDNYDPAHANQSSSPEQRQNTPACPISIRRQTIALAPFESQIKVSNPINSVDSILQQTHSQASDLKLMQLPARPIINRRQSICVDDNTKTFKPPSSITHGQPQNSLGASTSSRKHSIANEQIISSYITPPQENTNIPDNNISTECNILNQTTTSDNDYISSGDLIWQQLQPESSHISLMQTPARPVLSGIQSISVNNNDQILGRPSSPSPLQRLNVAPPINSKGHSSDYEQTSSSMAPSQANAIQVAGNNMPAKRKKPNRKTRFDIHPINTADLMLQEPPSNFSALKLMQPARPILNRRQSICVDNYDSTHANQSSSPELLQNPPACKILNRRQTIAVEHLPFGSQIMSSNPIKSVDLTLKRTQSQACDLKLMQLPARPIINRRQSICVDDNTKTFKPPSSITHGQPQNSLGASTSSRKHSITNEQIISSYVTPPQENTNFPDNISTECNMLNQTTTSDNDYMSGEDLIWQQLQPPTRLQDALGYPTNSQIHSNACEQTSSSMAPSQGNSSQDADNNMPDRRKRPHRKTRFDIHPINPADLLLQQAPRADSELQLMQSPARPIFNRRQPICVDNYNPTLGSHSSHIQKQNTTARPIFTRRQTIAIDNPPLFVSQMMDSNTISSRQLHDAVDKNVVAETRPTYLDNNSHSSIESASTAEYPIQIAIDNHPSFGSKATSSSGREAESQTWPANFCTAVLQDCPSNRPIQRTVGNKPPFGNQIMPSSFEPVRSAVHPIANYESQQTHLYMQPIDTPGELILPSSSTMAADSNDPAFKTRSTVRCIPARRQTVAVDNNIPTVSNARNYGHPDITRRHLTIADYNHAIANSVQANNMHANQFQRFSNNNNYRNQNDSNSSRSIYTRRKELASYNNNNEIPSLLDARFASTSRRKTNNGNNFNTTVWANNPFSDEQPSNFNVTQEQNQSHYRPQNDYIEYSRPPPYSAPRPPPPYPNYENQFISQNRSETIPNFRSNGISCRPPPLIRLNNNIPLERNYHLYNQWNYHHHKHQEEPQTQYCDRIQPWTSNTFSDIHRIECPHPEEHFPCCYRTLIPVPPVYQHNNYATFEKHYHLDNQCHHPHHQQRPQHHNRIQQWAPNILRNEQNRCPRPERHYPCCFIRPQFLQSLFSRR